MRDSSLQPELNEGNKIRLVTIKPNDLKAGLGNKSRAWVLLSLSQIGEGLAK